MNIFFKKIFLLFMCVSMLMPAPARAWCYYDYLTNTYHCYDTPAPEASALSVFLLLSAVIVICGMAAFFDTTPPLPRPLYHPPYYPFTRPTVYHHVTPTPLPAVHYHHDAHPMVETVYHHSAPKETVFHHNVKPTTVHHHVQPQETVYHHNVEQPIYYNAPTSNTVMVNDTVFPDNPGYLPTTKPTTVYTTVQPQEVAYHHNVVPQETVAHHYVQDTVYAHTPSGNAVMVNDTVFADE